MKFLIKSIIFLLFVIFDQRGANGEIPKKTMYLINRANIKGPYLGVIIPNTFELNPLLQSPSFTPSKLTIDFAGIYIHKLLYETVLLKVALYI